ncbi:hypothetical protein OIU77_023141 [Salix suchowensis]|uniref:Uncharacterized protein n=1 Tax=Salix suchowensis TaxID=1278906 RepID=A0ABQ9C2R7_9ROSI|nr:hypothetical protein OIU77_023141 [Salix suchowensis]
MGSEAADPILPWHISVKFEYRVSVIAINVDTLPIKYPSKRVSRQNSPETVINLEYAGKLLMSRYNSRGAPEILELTVRSPEKCQKPERRVTLAPLKYGEDNNDGVHNFLETGFVNLIESSNMYRSC